MINPKDLLIRCARLRLRRDAQRFARALAQPEQVQRQVLHEKIGRFASTDYGRRHGFQSIRDYCDFRRLPVVEYNNIRSYIERAMAGDWRAIVPEKPVMFGVTSGTTGNSKHIPLTRTFVNEYRRGANVWAYHLARRHPESLRNILIICSPVCEGHTAGGFPYGQISGLIAGMQNPLIRSLYVIPNRVFSISDCLARYYAIARCGITRDVTHLHTANFATILRLVKLAGEHADQIIRDVHDGTLSDAFEVEPAIRGQLRFRPDRRRARELERMADRADGRLLPRDYWPNLRVIGCWCGGTQHFSLNHMSKYFHPDTQVRDIGLLSTEARASIPLTNGEDSGPLDITSHFFEFIPESEICSSQPSILTVGELEVGQRYFLLLTTSSGLFRYNINDLIEVTDFVQRTPTIRFHNKGSHILSLVGEKLSESQVVAATDKAAQRIGLPVHCFKLCPVVDETASYKLLVELDGHRPLPAEVLHTLSRSLDSELGKLNSEYSRKRTSQRLADLQVVRVRHGAFERERERIVRSRNGRDFQYKHKYLETDPRFHERFLQGEQFR